MANGTFYYPSKTKEECLKYSFCWTPESIVTGLLSPLNPLTGKCSDGGIIQNLFEWEEAQWIGGTWVTTSWVSRQSVVTNAMRKTIDFPKLQSVVPSSSALSLKTSLQNQVIFTNIFFLVFCLNLVLF